MPNKVFSLNSVVKRVFEELPALKLFFINAVTENRLLTAQPILHKLNHPSIKLYLEFLDYVLPLFLKDLNKEMQAQDPKLHLLYKRVTVILATIFENFIKPKPRGDSGP